MFESAKSLSYTTREKIISIYSTQNGQIRTLLNNAWTWETTKCSFTKLYKVLLFYLPHTIFTVLKYKLKSNFDPVLRSKKSTEMLDAT